MSEVCHDVKVEPVLQPLTGEALRNKLLFVKMMPVLIYVLLVFGVFNINTHFWTFACLIPRPLLTGLQHLVLPTASMNRRSAMHMRKGFMRLFYPSATSGGIGKATNIAYKRLADLLSTKQNTPYPTLMGWLRCALNFSLLRSSIMCIRDSRLCSRHPGSSAPADFILAGSRASPLPPPQLVSL